MVVGWFVVIGMLDVLDVVVGWFVVIGMLDVLDVLVVVVGWFVVLGMLDVVDVLDVVAVWFVVLGVSVNADLRLINLKSIIMKNKITMIRKRIYSLSFHDVYNQLKTILDVLSVILL